MPNKANTIGRNNLYFGAGGQAADMSEFLARHYNVAVPEVDVGDDLLVVHDGNGTVWRIQVKSANSVPLDDKDGFSAQFNIRLSQLIEDKTPDLIYVFCVRHENHWADFVIIPRADLYGYYADLQPKFGSKVGTDSLQLYFSFAKDNVICSKQNLQFFRNNWDLWPVVDHPVVDHNNVPDAPLSDQAATQR